MERTGEWMRRARETLALAGTALRAWGPRQALVAAAAGAAVALVIGLATVLIPNPVFAREIPTVPWNYPVWILTSVLMGVLVATYVQPDVPPDAEPSGATARDTAEAGRDVEATAQPATSDTGAPVDGSERRSARAGGAAGILAWFAVGCPVCNKIALIALGYTGALTWFAPLQPFLAAIALVLATLAVVWRLRGQVVCPLPTAGRRAVTAP